MHHGKRLIRGSADVWTRRCRATTSQHEHDHHKAVNQRGDQVMGFSHDETKHYFRLYRDAGAIEVEAIDPNDTASRDQIRSHLRHISQMFAASDFNAPMLIHDQTPPGVPPCSRD